jgi:N-acetylneuraminic acid mutarotase
MQGVRFEEKGTNGAAMSVRAILVASRGRSQLTSIRRCWKIGASALAIVLSAAMVLAGQTHVGDELGLAPSQHHDDITGFEWHDAPPLTIPRASPAVIVLGDGDILVIGGQAADGPTATTEIFDMEISKWKPGPTMNNRRVGHTATLLKDGNVLIVGGDTGSGASASAELLDTGVSVSSPLPSMTFARSGHAAVLLEDGNVLVTGGTDWAKGIWKQAELYVAETHSWRPAGSMSSGRLFLTMHLLHDGTALAIGGDTNQTSERYNASTNSWFGVSKMLSQRSYSSSAIVVGKVLVAGGIVNNELVNSSEMYDPMTNSWSWAGNMTTARARFSLTPLTNGDLLAAGSQGVSTIASTEIFRPELLSWAPGLSMNVSRGSHGHAVTSEGATFVIGGKSGTTLTSSVEVFARTGITPPHRPCMPIDLVPLVEAATELPGNSSNGLISKLEAAQAQYDDDDIDTCLNIMNAFYNQVRAFARNGHMSRDHAEAIYEGYVSVVECLGGEPQPPFTYKSVAKFKDLAITQR